MKILLYVCDAHTLCEIQQNFFHCFPQIYIWVNILFPLNWLFLSKNNSIFLYNLLSSTNPFLFWLTYFLQLASNRSIVVEMQLSTNSTSKTLLFYKSIWITRNSLFRNKPNDKSMTTEQNIIFPQKVQFQIQVLLLTFTRVSKYSCVFSWFIFSVFELEVEKLLWLNSASYLFCLRKNGSRDSCFISWIFRTFRCFN